MLMAEDRTLFIRMIVNSSYEYPRHHWELDSSGRERAEGNGLSTSKQIHDLTVGWSNG